MHRGLPQRSNVAGDAIVRPGPLAGARDRPSVGEEETMRDPWAVLTELGVVALAFVLAYVGGSVCLRLRAPRAPGDLERRGASSASASSGARDRGHPR
jgi:hypothetical protein